MFQTETAGWSRYAAPMEPILAWRRPAATVALTALTLEVVWRSVLFGIDLAGRSAETEGPLLVLPSSSVALVLTVLVGLLAGSCCRAPLVAGGRGLARWGIALAAVSVLIELAGVAVGLARLIPGAFGYLVLEPIFGLAVPGLVGWGLLVVTRVPSGPSPLPQTSTEITDRAVDRVAAAEPEPVPEQEPIWSRDAAAGAVWRTAGDAARGAPAAQWSASDWGSAADPEAAARGEAQGSQDQQD